MDNLQRCIKVLSAGIVLLLTFSDPAAAQKADDVLVRIKEMQNKTKPGYYFSRELSARTGRVASCDGDCIMSIPLPVQLVYFNGERMDDRHVMLTWQTSGETNHDYFQVERSLDPAQGFELVGNLKGDGKGDVTSVKNYQMRDLNSFSAYSYYRLKQVDIDGTFQYSKLIGINGIGQPLKVAIYPNPGKAENINLMLSGIEKSDHLTITVTDITGKVVYQNANGRLSDKQEIQIGLPNVSSGVYYVKIATENSQTVSSYVLMR